MSTATAEQIVVDRDTASVPVTDVSPYEARWGFQFSQRDKIMSAYECGITKVPFAQFFAIKSFNAWRENHTTDEFKDRASLVTVPAAESELFLMEALGGAGAQNKVNWGLQTAFRGEEDAAKMAVISHVLVPSLPRIREISKELGVSVISEVCEGSDDLDYGVRDSCITCQWHWLNSPAVIAHMENMAMQGMPVIERDPATGEETQRSVKPTFTELKEALRVVLESGRQGLKQLQSLWAEIAGEYEKNDGFRKDISEFEHGYRKDLHQNKPQDRQFALAREIAKSTNAGAGDNGAMLNRLAEATIGLAEGQKQTNSLLGKLVAEKGNGINLADTSEVPVIALNGSTSGGVGEILPEGASETNLAPAAQKMQEAKNKREK